MSKALVGIADRDWVRRGGPAGATELAIHIDGVRSCMQRWPAPGFEPGYPESKSLAYFHLYYPGFFIIIQAFNSTLLLPQTKLW